MIWYMNTLPTDNKPAETPHTLFETIKVMQEALETNSFPGVRSITLYSRNLDWTIAEYDESRSEWMIILLEARTLAPVQNMPWSIDVDRTIQVMSDKIDYKYFTPSITKTTEIYLWCPRYVVPMDRDVTTEVKLSRWTFFKLDLDTREVQKIWNLEYIKKRTETIEQVTSEVKAKIDFPVPDTVPPEERFTRLLKNRDRAKHPPVVRISEEKMLKMWKKRDRAAKAGIPHGDLEAE